MIQTFKYTPLTASILLALSGPIYSPLIVAAPGEPVGSEFQVNTFTSGTQNASRIAIDADGGFVITWQSNNQDGSKHGVYAQRYQADGTAAGSEFLVNTEIADRQFNPSIAMDADGDFVITWASYYQDGNGYGVYAQRYQADGTAAGSEFQVSTETSGNQNHPSVAMDEDGDFVIAWESFNQDSNSIYAQRYQADGTAAGSEFQVNTETNNEQANPSIALDADGNFVIAWQSDEQDGSDYGIYAQRYQADGTAAGNEFQVNTFTTGDQFTPNIGLDADGNFVIVWQSNNQDGNGYGVYGQLYQSNGTVVGSEFQVNTETFDNQRNPSVALDSEGNFVITWSSEHQDNDGRGTYAQRYQADGAVIGNEFQVNTFTIGNQFTPDIALNADSGFVITWASDGEQDGDGSGVYAQRYEGETINGSGVDLNLVVDDDTDPVEAGDSFVYALTVTNNGTINATDVNLSNPIPASLSYVSDDSASAGWDCELIGTTLNCNKPSMSVSEVSNINLTVTAAAIGTLSNTASVTATETDIDSSDNTATETTTVIDTTAPIITLLGGNPISVAQGTIFTDPGVSTTDNADIDLVATVTGSVDTNTLGSYTLNYNVADSSGNAAIEVQRTVTVVDTTIPVITLLGDNPLSVTQNTTFTDPGSTVTDNIDTALIATVTGSVDTAAVGTYTLNYNVTDSAGNTATEVTRTINVVVEVTPPAPTRSRGGGSLGIATLFIAVPLWLRRRIRG